MNGSPESSTRPDPPSATFRPSPACPDRFGTIAGATRPRHPGRNRPRKAGTWHARGLEQIQEQAGKARRRKAEMAKVDPKPRRRREAAGQNSRKSGKPGRVRLVAGINRGLETGIARASNCRRAISESATPNGRKRGGLTTKKIDGRKYLQYFQAVGIDGITVNAFDSLWRHFDFRVFHLKLSA